MGGVLFSYRYFVGEGGFGRVFGLDVGDGGSVV